MSLDEKSEAYLKFLKHPSFIPKMSASRLPFGASCADIDSFIQKGRHDFARVRKALEKVWDNALPLGEGFFNGLKTIENRAYFINLPEFIELTAEMRTLALMHGKEGMSPYQKETLWEGMSELGLLFKTVERCQRDQSATYPLSQTLARVVFELRKAFIAPILPPPGVEKLELVYSIC